MIPAAATMIKSQLGDFEGGGAGTGSGFVGSLTTSSSRNFPVTVTSAANFFRVRLSGILYRLGT